VRDASQLITTKTWSYLDAQLRKSAPLEKMQGLIAKGFTQGLPLLTPQVVVKLDQELLT
jgi:hypothetical protein